MAFIRPYKSEDYDATAHICRETMPPSLQGSEPTRRLCAYIWTHQYTYLSPQTCFVLDDGTGRAVGYCIGCPDIPSFCTAYPSYTSTILDPSPDITRPATGAAKASWLDADGQISELCLTQMAYDPQRLLLEGNDDLTRLGYRATMHIDLLPEWQGRGWGRTLIDRFVASVTNAVVAKGVGDDGVATKGIWIGVAADNSKVVGFYERMGFRVLVREEKMSKSFTMVRDL